eukprot:6195313-Pleurochrysis_carterae.AAC.2
MPRYDLLYLSHTEQQQLLQRISHGHHLIVQALKAFWELEVTLSEQFIRDKATPDLARAIPLAHNNFFKLTRLLKSWHQLEPQDTTRIDHIFINENKRHD